VDYLSLHDSKKSSCLKARSALLAFILKSHRSNDGGASSTAVCSKGLVPFPSRLSSPYLLAIRENKN
jgi:hypothetical protein